MIPNYIKIPLDILLPLLLKNQLRDEPANGLRFVHYGLITKELVLFVPRLNSEGPPRSEVSDFQTEKS